MTRGPDHLIERAAARLKPSNVGTTIPNREIRDGSSEVGREASSATGHETPWQLNTETGFRKAVGTHKTASNLEVSSQQEAVNISALERAGLMVARLSRTRTSEEYRIVIGRLLRALHELQNATPELRASAFPNAVMVTSARPGEGKSFTSLNLGGSIAQNAGESVLIVDVDAKNNSLSDNLELSGRKGFLDLVADSTLSSDNLIVPSALRNLSFLPIGTRSSSADGGLLDARSLIPPIQQLARRFPQTLILLDAPPCLSTSDPHTFAPIVGQVVIVVEAEKTQRSEVEAAIDMIKECPTITMLLNKVKMNSNHTFGTYDYFGSYV